MLTVMNIVYFCSPMVSFLITTYVLGNVLIMYGRKASNVLIARNEILSALGLHDSRNMMLEGTKKSVSFKDYCIHLYIQSVLLRIRPGLVGKISTRLIWTKWRL